MKCTECAYYWAECDDRGNPIERPCCHYQWNDGYAPCEVDDVYETIDD